MKTAHAYENLVRIPGPDYEIPATECWPNRADKTKKVPAVLLLHGTGGFRDEIGDLFKRLAYLLAKDGIMSLRIDFAGCGDSKVPHLLNNLDRSVLETSLSLDYMCSLEGVDTERIGLFGFSQGGRIAQITAARDKRIQALAEWAPASGNGMGDVHFLGNFYAEAQEKGQVIMPFFDRQLHLSLEWFQAFEKSRALDEIAAYDRPLLTVHGTADTIVSIARSEDLIRCAGGTDKTLHLVVGGDHSFNVIDQNGQLAEDQSYAEEAINVTAGWLAEKFKI